jgi:hypothetical protein
MLVIETQESVSVPGTLYDHRIFGPENSSSNQMPTRNSLNFLHAKMGQQERFVANPNKPHYRFFSGTKKTVITG